MAERNQIIRYDEFSDISKKPCYYFYVPQDHGIGERRYFEGLCLVLWKNDERLDKKDLVLMNFW